MNINENSKKENKVNKNIILSFLMLMQGAFAYESVYFETDSAVIPESEMIKVAQIATGLQVNFEKIVITGHADERGNNVYNLILGQQRAQAVADALKSYGVDQGQIVAVSYGKENPRAPHGIREHLSLNRRVEVIPIAANVVETQKIVKEEVLKRHRVSVLGGFGPNGINGPTVLSPTELQLEQDIDFLVGFGYSYRLNSRWNVGVNGFTNNSWFLSLGMDFNLRRK